MEIVAFVQEFKDKKITNSKIAPDAIGNFIKEKIEITPYLPFRAKRELAELVVKQSTPEVGGIKRHDAIESYMRFVIGTIETHTDLKFNIDDPVADYDLLAESGLLMPIISTFQADYDECNAVLKMALDAELEDNNLNVQIGKFLNGILAKLDGVGDALKGMLEGIDLGQILGGNFNQEDLTKLKSFVDSYNK